MHIFAHNSTTNNYSIRFSIILIIIRDRFRDQVRSVAIIYPWYTPIKNAQIPCKCGGYNVILGGYFFCFYIPNLTIPAHQYIVMFLSDYTLIIYAFIGKDDRGNSPWQQKNGFFLRFHVAAIDAHREPVFSRDFRVTAHRRHGSAEKQKKSIGAVPADIIILLHVRPPYYYNDLYTNGWHTGQPRTDASYVYLPHAGGYPISIKHICRA